MLRRANGPDHPRTGPCRQRACSLPILIVLGLLLTWLPRAALAERGAEPVTLAVVVGPDNPTRDLSHQRLRRAFLGQTVQGADGRRLVPLNHPPRSVDRVGFDRVALGMTPNQVARFWIDRRIRGDGHAPRSVGSIATLQRVVARLPGAIAYLRPDQLDEDLRALTIDGHEPGEANYPIVYRP